jgi:hypothetical protein
VFHLFLHVVLETVTWRYSIGSVFWVDVFKEVLVCFFIDLPFHRVISWSDGLNIVSNVGELGVSLQVVDCD